MAIGYGRRAKRYFNFYDFALLSQAKEPEGAGRAVGASARTLFSLRIVFYSTEAYGAEWSLQLDLGSTKQSVA